MSETILRTKLFKPPLRPLLVDRPRLIQRLDGGAIAKLILVAAPAGFGKTTIIAHWLEQQGQPAAWLSLDENDNEPGRFFIYLLTAVQTVYPNLAKTLSTSLQSTNPPDEEAVLPALLNEFSSQADPLRLVLDDYHVIENPFIHEAITFLIDAMPPHIQLVITSREDPPLPLPRWRVRGQLTELHDIDLRFTREEAAEFLAKTMGLDLPDTAVTTLEKRTEGWVAGLQLAALSLRSTDTATDFINSFTGSDRQIADYLLQEVLLRQTEAVQQFLLRTSILERFNADLCDTLLEQNNSQDILDELDQANLFLIPLDNHRFWYRYHHLFAQLLQYRYQREVAATAVADLRLRAARWYESENLPEEAINQALQIPDYDYAASLLASLPLNNLYAPDGTSLVKQWANTLPGEMIRKYPQVGVMVVGAYMTTGDPVMGQKYLQLIADEPSVYPEYCLFRSIIVRNEQSDYEQALQLAEEAAANLAGRDTSLLVIALMQVAVNNINLGRLAAARQKVIDMRQLLQRQPDEDLNIHLQAIYMHASAVRSQADLFHAEQICQEGLELAANNNQIHAPMSGWLHAMLANIYYEWNELSQAQELVTKATTWAERSGISDIRVQANFAQANLACVAGDSTTVHTLTQTLQNMAKSSNMKEVVTLTDAYVSYFLMRVGELETAVRWANAAPFTLADDPPFHKFDVYRILALVRLRESWALAEKRLAPKILALVKKLQQCALEADHQVTLIEALAMKAIVLDWQGETEAALTALKQSLDLSVAGSMVRVYLDLGEPMHQLLRKTLPHQPTYVARLLQAFADEQTAVPNATAPVPSPVSLTEREMDVLQAIAAGLSNKEIEESLIISKNTVRTHIKNLYSKLDVKSRTQAIRKAQELQIL